MLTATYSLVAMSIEQKQALRCLEHIRQAVAALWQNPQQIDRQRVEAAFRGLARFDRYCHQRKVEKYVIPTVRGASGEIDAVVQQLEGLSGAGLTLLGAAGEQLQAFFDRQAIQAREMVSAMEAYCDCLRQRLLQEEELLLPLVRRMLSVEDWFLLAAKFLGDEQRRPE
jgi:hemerythrin-like domain-containing protein